ncbi:hypothetical protein [Staphylospora marina]|uniref:hypothetical protein n=1 Tax=Staphylospora marina TaxID=2490858 RepID=UPI000F5BA93A|nr:hypothetical protein [Staphylospora marina]
MINLLKAVLSLFRSTLNLIESAFIAFYVGSSFNSLALMVVLFVTFMGSLFLNAVIPFVLGWAFLAFVAVYLNIDQPLITALVVALIAGGIRYLISRIRFRS